MNIELIRHVKTKKLLEKNAFFHTDNYKWLKISSRPSLFTFYKTTCTLELLKNSSTIYKKRGALVILTL